MLRVVGGEFRSRKIKEVPSKETRPTTDKNKEAIFNMMGQYFHGGRALDLFAGSGALGLEALSRGIEMVDFVDSFVLACKTIEENIKTLKVESQSNIHRMDALSFLQSSPMQYDLILADPPYKLHLYEAILETINSRQLLASSGIIVFEADKQVVFPERVGLLVRTKERIFGITKFTFYEMGEEE